MYKGSWGPPDRWHLKSDVWNDYNFCSFIASLQKMLRKQETGSCSLRGKMAQPGESMGTKVKGVKEQVNKLDLGDNKRYRQEKWSRRHRAGAKEDKGLNFDACSSGNLTQMAH